MSEAWVLALADSDDISSWVEAVGLEAVGIVDEARVVYDTGVVSDADRLNILEIEVSLNKGLKS